MVAGPPNLVSPANLLGMRLSPASRSFTKTLKSDAPKMKPWRTPLGTGCQPDVTPFPKTLWARPISPLFTHSIVCSSKYMLGILSTRKHGNTILNKDHVGVELPSLQKFKSCLHMVLGSHLEVALLEQEVWTGWLPEVIRGNKRSKVFPWIPYEKLCQTAASLWLDPPDLGG